MRSSEIRKSFNIEPLLLRIKRSQIRWSDHVSRMPQKKLSKQALLVKANGKRPVGRPRIKWTIYIKDLGWNHLGLYPSEIMEDRKVQRLNLELLPQQPSRKSEQWRKKKSNLSDQIFCSLIVFYHFSWCFLSKHWCWNRKKLYITATDLHTSYILMSCLGTKNLNTQFFFCNQLAIKVRALLC